MSTKTSPGAGSWRITAATASGIAPRWTGMCSAWAIIRPRSSKIAAEQSRRSLMLAEKDERMSTAPISSAIDAERAAENLELNFHDLVTIQLPLSHP